MSTKIAIGDIVEVLHASTAWGHMEGVEGEVLDIFKDNKTVLVKDPTGQGMWPREGGSGWWFSTRDVEKIEPVEPKVGDTVRVLKTSNWHKLGETGKVQSVSSDDTIRVNDWWISPKEVELVTEKPKARSQEIAKEEIQKGDLIVSFWNKGGVELRKKGVAYEKDYEADWTTKGGEYLTYDDSHDAAEHVYLLERTEKEPVGFDALDKTKKYLLKGRDGATDFMLAFEEGNWTYGWVGDNTRVNAKQFEKGYTEGNGSWEKPVEYKEPELADGTYWVTTNTSGVGPWRVTVDNGYADWEYGDEWQHQAHGSYELLVAVKEGARSDMVFHTEDPTPPKTDLDKHTEAGTIGNRYRAGNVLYKVTKKGKVKGIITNDTHDSRQTVIWDFETFQDYVDRGIIHKIS